MEVCRLGSDSVGGGMGLREKQQVGCMVFGSYDSFSVADTAPPITGAVPAGIIDYRSVDSLLFQLFIIILNMILLCKRGWLNPREN